MDHRWTNRDGISRPPTDNPSGRTSAGQLLEEAELRHFRQTETDQLSQAAAAARFRHVALYAQVPAEDLRPAGRSALGVALYLPGVEEGVQDVAIDVPHVRRDSVFRSDRLPKPPGLILHLLILLNSCRCRHLNHFAFHTDHAAENCQQSVRQRIPDSVQIDQVSRGFLAIVSNNCQIHSSQFQNKWESIE